MVRALDSGALRPGFKSCLGHCIVTLGNRLDPRSVSFHPGKFTAGVTLQWTSILSRMSSNTPSHIMFSWDKFGSDRPPGLNADFTLGSLF